MKYVKLPNVDKGFGVWTLKPTWIRVNSHLHAIFWIEPKDGADERFYVHSHKSTMYVRPFPKTLGDDSTARTTVTCGREEVVGFVHDPLDEKYQLCSQCCLIIQRFMRGEVLNFWSDQLAEARAASRAKRFASKSDPVSEWAVKQFPSDNPQMCCKMAKELEASSPNKGTNIVTERFGEMLGVPSVVFDPSDESMGVLRRIVQGAEDMMRSLESGARKRIAQMDQPAFKLDGKAEA
jgi:hypothetical protein